MPKYVATLRDEVISSIKSKNNRRKNFILKISDGKEGKCHNKKKSSAT